MLRTFSDAEIALYTKAHPYRINDPLFRCYCIFLQRMKSKNLRRAHLEASTTFLRLCALFMVY